MIERIDIVCTGGKYDDPVLGPTPRHPRQKLGRLHVSRHGDKFAHGIGQRVSTRKCPQCGRVVPVATTTTRANYQDLPPGAAGPDYFDGGVWQRILQWAARERTDRRVITVDISDDCYPW